MFVAIISLLGAALSAYLARTEYLRRKNAAADPTGKEWKRGFGWAGIFLAFQVFIGVYAAFGLVQNDILSAIVFNAAFILCVTASAKRDLIAGALDRAANKPAFRGKIPRKPLIMIATLALVGVFATLGLEIPSNHNLLWMYPLCLLLEWALITAVLSGFYLLFQRRGGVPAFLSFVLFGIGVAEFFVITFKSMPIQPGDLSALTTAMAVAGTGYTYELNAFCLYGLAFTGIAMLLCEVAGCFRAPKDQRTRRGLVINLLIGVLCIAGVGAHVTMLDYYHQLNITIYTWRPLESYYRQGFIPTFISGAQTVKPPLPHDYEVDAAKKMINSYAKEYDKTLGTDAGRMDAEAQFNEDKPTVIAIMNETFADMSIYQEMHAGYKGPQFFKNLPDALSRGTLYVSAYGGGTCNTEFEFMTGNSMANLGAGVYPYTIYDLTKTPNLAEQFDKLGYVTTAMHPNHGTNWNRENVYHDFGFQNFLTIKDFQGAEQLRGMVTDAATYDKILEMLKANEAPQFIFDVTMQNHSGYDTGLVPPDKQVNLLIDGVADPEVNEYVSLIEESDRALKEFIGKLRKLDRKVVVVFWGDHQPFFPSKFNDQWFPGENETQHAMRLWQTDYLIWANYDVAGRDQESTRDDLSTNYLGTELMNLIGAPLNKYQKAQLCLRDALPAINSTGYMDRNQLWRLSNAQPTGVQDDSAAVEADKARDDYAHMQYYTMFGDGKNPYTLHAQTAANETDPNLAPGTTKIK